MIVAYNVLVFWIERLSLAMHSEPLCATCGILIRWQPTIVDGRIYCCPGCSHGGPCECDYDNLPHPNQINAMVLQEADIKRWADRPDGAASGHRQEPDL